MNSRDSCDIKVHDLRKLFRIKSKNSNTKKSDYKFSLIYSVNTQSYYEHLLRKLYDQIQNSLVKENIKSKMEIYQHNYKQIIALKESQPHPKVKCYIQIFK